MCWQIISLSFQNQRQKNDYAEINHIRYGLFSVDVWKKQIVNILSEEIDKIGLSSANKKKIKAHLEVLLSKIIDEIAKKIEQENVGSASGWVKQHLMNIFVSLDEIKRGIPEYADAVIREMSDPISQDQIRVLLKQQLKTYAETSFDNQDTSAMNIVLRRWKSPDVASARTAIERSVSDVDGQIAVRSYLIITLSVVLFCLIGFGKKPLTVLQYCNLISSLIILLVASVTTPMIDMEAKITCMSFVLLGHTISFDNQVLYFQSKSILDVFWIMITDPKIQMKLVGCLLVTFSIVFPISKMTSSAFYYFDYHHARDNWAIKFFVLKSGKWSMADVMVMAIFMAYIGFSGIVTSQLDQLDQLKNPSQNLTILSTNATSLQPGFYLFLTYSLLAMIFAALLEDR